MGFLSNLLGLNQFLQGNGRMTCKSKNTYRYYLTEATDERQCRCCGKTIKPGKQVVAYLTDREAGAVYGGGGNIDEVTTDLYCSLDCFRRGN